MTDETLKLTTDLNIKSLTAALDILHARLPLGSIKSPTKMLNLIFALIASLLGSAAAQATSYEPGTGLRSLWVRRLEELCAVTTPSHEGRLARACGGC